MIQGYGLTEAAAATCLSPTGIHREGGIGIPFPDVLYKIVKIGTTKEVKTLEDGEICICGPTVMMGYLNEEEETACSHTRLQLRDTLRHQVP